MKLEWWTRNELYHHMYSLECFSVLYWMQWKLIEGYKKLKLVGVYSYNMNLKKYRFD